ncbi:plakophilin-1 [Hemiscyllium ocellatum]|uniref:plakophilin-1 n=1 Tax=Hemiscyllium ocellatum TaxID=170820 RepID=UPI002965EFAE|nr:plakophilin-1 [Hemiscyllium ocellatum]
MAYVKTVTAGECFSNQSNSTLALPPADKLSTLARMDSEKRVGSQVRMMMENKRNQQKSVKKELANGQWNMNQREIFDFGNSFRSMTIKNQGTQRRKGSQYDGTMKEFSSTETYATGVPREYQQKSHFSSFSVKGKRTISMPSHYRKHSGPQSPMGDNEVFSRQMASSRSEPDLLNMQNTQTIRRLRSKYRPPDRTKSLYARRSIVHHSAMLPDTKSQEKERLNLQASRIQSTKRGSTIYRTANGIRDFDSSMNLKKAVMLLSDQDPSILAYAASYIQHECFKEDTAKTAISEMKAIPQLINLLGIKNNNVQQSVCGALRNAVYKNVNNKLEVKKNGGIKPILQILRETNDLETQKQITGLLWNLSSCDELKDVLIKEALPALTESVIIPHTSEKYGNPRINDPEVFYNATGCLRNLSSAGQEGRQLMRNCNGLIDSLMTYTQTCINANQVDAKSVENCVCILHNLTYHLDTEVPAVFSHINAKGNVQSQNRTTKKSSVGCFSPGSDQFDEPDLDNMPFPKEDDNPKGVDNLSHSKAIKMYTSLLGKSKSDATLEACAGALQNLTASNKMSSYLMSSNIVNKERALPRIANLLQSSNPDIQKTAVSLLNNMSRHNSLQPDLASQTLPELARLLPGGGNSSKTSDDTIASACNIMRNLVPNNTAIAKTVLQGSMLNNLMSLSKSSAYPSAGKAACLFLYEMWAQKDLQNFFKREGFSKKDFVNHLTSAAVKLAQQNAGRIPSKKFL